jgi:hypothetical protein
VRVGGRRQSAKLDGGVRCGDEAVLSSTDAIALSGCLPCKREPESNPTSTVKYSALRRGVTGM